MAWKKSKDGGIDFDVNLEHKKRKDEFNDENFSFTASTVIYNENFHEVKFDDDYRNEYDRIF